MHPILMIAVKAALIAATASLASTASAGWFLDPLNDPDLETTPTAKISAIGLPLRSVPTIASFGYQTSYQWQRVGGLPWQDRTKYYGRFRRA